MTRRTRRMRPAAARARTGTAAWRRPPASTSTGIRSAATPAGTCRASRGSSRAPATRQRRRSTTRSSSTRSSSMRTPTRMLTTATAMAMRMVTAATGTGAAGGGGAGSVGTGAARTCTPARAPALCARSHRFYATRRTRRARAVERSGPTRTCASPTVRMRGTARRWRLRPRSARGGRSPSTGVLSALRPTARMTKNSAGSRLRRE
mmetsp:Transcript_8343/g.33804  ORF Transcript_8343/g.33804 Transcript_8343/m.33804 type:complete len:206 (-) Transcript_8343:597-1214(-)